MPSPSLNPCQARALLGLYQDDQELGPFCFYDPRNGAADRPSVVEKRGEIRVLVYRLTIAKRYEHDLRERLTWTLRETTNAGSESNGLLTYLLHHSSIVLLPGCCGNGAHVPC